MVTYTGKLPFFHIFQFQLLTLFNVYIIIKAPLLTHIYKNNDRISINKKRFRKYCFHKVFFCSFYDIEP